ncbi:MAG: MobF family relaxase [Streptosporangiales bacterium]
MGHLGFAPRSDWRYLPRHAQGGGRGDDQPTPGERDAGNYYMASVEGGEPAGRWYGPGAGVLGFEAGSEVASEQMEQVYGKLEHPQTGEQLGSKPRTYASHEERLARLLAAEPDALPERRAEIAFQARKQQREPCHYYDLTYSPEKSWSVLYAGLKLAGMDAEADALWQCVEDGYRVGLEHAMASACYARTGRHAGKVAGRTSGRWEKAQDWTVTLWRHHTSRDGDPNLHIHGALLNRVRTADGRWFAVDGTAVKHARREAAAVASRAAEAYAAERLGLRFTARPDGLGREIAGVDQELIDQFSSRRRAIEPEAQRLAQAYLERYGREPSAYELRLFAQQATMRTRQRKPNHPPTQAEQLRVWEAQVRDQLGVSLAQVPVQVGVRPANQDAQVGEQGAQAMRADAQADAQERSAAAQVGEGDAHPGAALTAEQRAQVIAQAVAQVSGKRAVWRRSDLVAAIDAHLPVETLTLPAAAQEQLLDELTTEALTGGQPVRLSADPLVEPPAQWRRASDGRGLHAAAAVYDRYSTRATLGREEQLLGAAQQHGAATADHAVVEEQLEATDLRADQRAVVEQVLTSGQRVDVLVGPAGAGKSHTLGQLAQTWTHTVQPREGEPAARVLGLAPSEAATRVLGDAGIERRLNIDRFRTLVRGRRASLQDDQRQLAVVGKNDLVVLDEASMASTSDVQEVLSAAGEAGAKVLLAGDDHQLGAVEEGGAFALLAGRCQPSRLAEAVRFTHEWEREASLRLRDGDSEALREYDRRDRIHAGTSEEVGADARERFLADYLSGRDTLILTSTSEAAAEQASHIRQVLVGQGDVEDAGVRLHDVTTAGVGDLVQTRQNDRRLGDGAGGWVANRDTWRVEERGEDGSLVVCRQLPRTGTGEHAWGEPVTLPASYVGEQVELGYASTVHAAQGRTVDTGYVLVDPQMSPEALYVAATRGRERNLLFVPTDQGVAEPLGAQDTEPAERPTPEAILAGILERDRPVESAVQARDEEADARESLARLAGEWQDLITTDAHARYRDQLGVLLSSEQRERLEGDPAYAPLLRAVRAAEASGRDADQLLTQAVTGRELDSATSVGQVLHHRVSQDTPPEHLLADGSYVSRTPRLTDPDLDAYAHELAEAMDTRVSVLGERVATDPPKWASPLGPVPEEPAERLEWTRRAGLIAGYREEHGYHSAADAIGAAPHAGAPEARQGWLAAWEALGRPDEERDTAAASAGSLWNVLQAWEREQQTAPANVNEELRRTARTVDDADRDARRAAAFGELARASGDDPSEEDRSLQQARQAETAARQRLAALEEQAAQRAAWYEANQRRQRAAQLAQHELDRRRDRELTQAAQEQRQQDEAQRPDREAGVDRQQSQETPARENETREPRERLAVLDRDADEPGRDFDWPEPAAQPEREQAEEARRQANPRHEDLERRSRAEGWSAEEAARQREDDDLEYEERQRGHDEPDRDRGIEL